MTDRPDLVVISCGRRKRAHPAPAGVLYTGNYYILARAAAIALRPVHGWWILSALYGLLHPDTVISPYNLRLGQPGSITPKRLRQQIIDAGLSDLSRVVILTSSDYVQLARAAWPHACTPLLGVGRLGHQMQRLRHIRMEGRVACPARSA